MWPHLSVRGGEQLFVLSLLSSLPQSVVLAEPPSPPSPCPASAPGLSPAGASTDWQEETPLLLLSSRGCLGLQPQSPVLSCARCGMVQVWGMLKGEVWLLFSWFSQWSLWGSAGTQKVGSKGWREEARVTFCALQGLLQLSQPILCFLAEFHC